MHLECIARMDLVEFVTNVFLYLNHATSSIPDEHREQVFKEMARKIYENRYVTITYLRETLALYGVDFNNLCARCGSEMVNAPEFQEFCSDECERD
jgi:hypothetical protein